MQVVHVPRWSRLLSLAPLALLVVSACSQGPVTYTGSQPRTPIEKIPSGGEMKNFQLVGQNQLLDPKFNLPRGMGGGITAIRDCLYAGSSIAYQPTLILDMKDLTKPTVVGEVPGIAGKGMGIEAIEAVGDLNLLVNTARNSKGWTEAPPKVAPADTNVGLVVYDATDCKKPTIVSKIDVKNTFLHYMTLWRDPNKPDRVFVSVTYNSGVPEDGVDVRVWDLTGCPKSCNPKLAGEWGLRAQLGIPANVTTKYEGGTRVDNTQTHDVTWSLDGRRMHLAQTKYGYLQIDSSALAEGRSCDPSPAKSKTEAGHCLSVLPDFKPLAAFGTEVANVHGVVSIPGRPYVAIQHEGHACPFGGITFAYIGDKDTFSTYDRQTGQLVAPGGAGSVGVFRGDLYPRNVGTFAIPEQNPDRCPRQGDQIPPTTAATGIYGADVMRSSKTVHNALAFPSVLFATWYGAGLRAIDITNPSSPFELGYFFNKPVPEVRYCSEGSAGPCDKPELDAEGVPVRVKQLLPPDVFARSYPILMNGHIVYYDENSGIYVLKYTGPHANELPQTGLCISHNPNVVTPGFEPCAPYKTWSP
ncbi:MAG: hypothetical protein E6H88_08800 [Chloroflexi bacterium]|nr:MAG: hypothetical protein E6H88_08800 [Chloroflexota bacterium]